jgi:hypothetical protein
MPDSPIIPSQTNQTANSTYPGVGIKRPEDEEEETKAADSTTGSSIKSKYGKKPKNTNRGRSPDALSSNGAIAATSGTSMGTKANDAEFWAGSAFGKK